MKSLAALAVSGLILIGTPGCHAMSMEATSIEPSLYMARSPAAENPQVLGDFEARTTGAWLFWGLSKIRDPDVSGELDAAVQGRGGDGVAGLTITTQQTFVDGLLSLITLGIYSQRTTILRGMIVEDPPEPPAGEGAGPSLK